MRRLSALLLLVVLAVSVYAQQPPAAPANPDDLLRRVHALSVNLPPINRGWLLGVMLEKAMALRQPLPELGQWAEELFVLSLQLPLDKKNQAQRTAINAMTRVDADRALAMLNQMEIAPSTMPRSMTAAMVFSAMLRQHGDAVMPDLIKAVNRLAAGGSYPYLAVSALMPRSTPEQRDVLFLNAVQSYSQSAPEMGNDSEFVTFFKGMARLVSPATAKATAPPIAVRLLRFAESDPVCQYNARYYSDKGVAVLECGDAVVWGALPSLRLLDPARADGVVANRRTLQQEMLTPERPGSPIRMAKPGMTITSEQSVEGFDQANVVLQTARKDIDAAIKLLPTVTDEIRRLNALSLIAKEALEKHPDRARQLMKEVAAKLPSAGDDPIWKLTILTNIARVAEKLHDNSLVEQWLREAFVVGPKYIAASKEVDAERRLVRAYNGYHLDLITRSGARITPQLTLQLVDGIADEEARGYLLLAYADALAHPESKS